MQAADFDFQQNYFQLFGLELSCRLDLGQLDKEYRALQVQFHPDKAAHLSEAEQRVSMQRATRVNEAYQILRNPLKRARYLLSLHGVDIQEENNTLMPMDFLMEQMEWRETVSEAQQAHNLDEIARVETRLKQDTKAMEVQLADKIDVEKDYVSAASVVRKLCFMDKLAEDIRVAYDLMDG